MIAPPERSADRDAVLAALLPRVPVEGWTRLALRRALAETGGEAADADLLFPGGAAELIEAFIDLTDRRMADDAVAADLAGLRTPARVRAVIALRLARLRPHKEAVRRAVALLALPRNAPVAARALARTVDTIWYAAGDRAADFSWYSKRATLAGIYLSTLLYWLRDVGEDDAATLAFLDRRLASVGGVGALRQRIAARWAQIVRCQLAT